MKTCTICNIEKPETEFYPQSGGKNGLESRCKLCNRASYKKWYAERTAKLGHSPYKHKNREYQLRHHYGLKPEDVPNSCQICGAVTEICVDHDHATGKVRGFLCHPCNLILGKANDDPNLLRQLADYLEK